MLDYGNKQLIISEYRSLYDIIISKDNLLRKIKENIDFSFVNPMLEESYCKYYGRPAKEPEMMFKLMFLKSLYDLSDEKLIQNANHDMSYKFFLGLDPEDKLIDSSLLTKFRKTRIKSEDILNEMLKETVRQAIEKGIIKGNTIIVDATHTKSKSKPETPTQMLRKMSKELRKIIYKNRFEISNDFPEKPSETDTLENEIEYSKKLIAMVENSLKDSIDKEIEKRLSELKEILENDKLEQLQSVVDEDAKQGYKSETNSFFGYKSHIAMSEERIITAIDVTSGEAPDGKYLEGLINDTEKNGVKVSEVLADSAYSGKDNLEFMNSKEIKAVTKLNPLISNTMTSRNDDFEYIKDADMMRCPAGNLSKSKYRSKNKSRKNKNEAIVYSFDVNKCKDCPIREGCYKPGAKKKTYHVTIKSDVHVKQQKFQDSEYFKERAKQRYMIEAKNAELKQHHGLNRCKYQGLFAMRKQAYFTAFVVNVKRILKVLDKKAV
jgi:IS5 family transposase